MIKRLAVLIVLPLSSVHANEARVTAVVGQVYLHTTDLGSDEWVEAEADSPLEEGDKVRTTGGATVEITLDGETVIFLDENSEFKADSLKSQLTRFFLSWGALSAKIRKLREQDSQFQIKTPVAVAAVRGTELAISYEDGKPAVVGVFDEGQVAVQADGHQEVILNPGQETEIAQGQKPLSPHPLEKLSVARPNLVHIRERIVFLKPRWQALPPAKRLEFRARLLKKPRLDLNRPHPNFKGPQPHDRRKAPERPRRLNEPRKR